MLGKEFILGIGITAARKKDILKDVFFMVDKGRKLTIVTPNPEIIVYANRHDSYRKIINNARVSLPDGVGVLVAAKIMRKSLQERITGVDFMEDLCRESSKKHVSMGFLGGRPGIAERAAECLLAKYPKLDIVFVGADWSEAGYTAAERLRRTLRNTTQNYSEKPSDKFVSHIRGGSKKETLKNRESMGRNMREIDILFVAYGAPKQEEWIAENLEKLPVKVAMGVGGAFDYISGEVSRAPSIVRALGLEWLFRLIRQPWRWKRQLALVEFVWLVLLEKYFQRRTKQNHTQN